MRVLAGDGSLVCRRKAIPTVDSLEQVEQAALAGVAPATRLEVVVEPTGPAWLPIAVFFSALGHTVYRVSSAKAHDLRRVLQRHAKSNGIHADTLARLPLVDPAGLHPLGLPDAARPAPGRRVRACDRLTQQAASACATTASHHARPTTTPSASASKAPLQEFYRPAFHRQHFTRLTDLNAQFQGWLQHYNTRRPNRSDFMRGRTPYTVMNSHLR